MEFQNQKPTIQRKHQRLTDSFSPILSSSLPSTHELSEASIRNRCSPPRVIRSQRFLIQIISSSGRQNPGSSEPKRLFLGGHIPYCDSNLTRILQSALGGNAKTSIICTIAPEEVRIEETKGTLQFASRAKRITNYAHVNDASFYHLEKRKQLSAQ